MRKLLVYLHDDLYLELICLIVFILSFCFEPITTVWNGYLTILTSTSILLTDYVYIAGIGATLLNVSTILAFNLILLKILKVDINGPIYCGVLMIVGFSFFGKNMINTLPIYLGIFLYSRWKKVYVKTLVISLLFSTGISPLVSYCFFGFGLPFYASIPLGVFCGALAGFIIPAYASHTLTFHQGYNLFNMGFALGILSMIFYAIFTACGQTIETVNLYDGSDSVLFYYLLFSLSGISIVLSLIYQPKVLLEYHFLLKTSGKLISDYIYEFSVEAVLLNVGVLGILTGALGLIFNIPLNGILFGSILTILGCGAYGLHVRNLLPIWLGAFLMIIIKMAIAQDFSIDLHRDISMLMSFVFAACLAPVAGKYGIIYGILGGMLHMIVTPVLLNLQGGFDLYNNGFAAGFEASILVVCAEKIFYKEKKRLYAKK